MNDLLKLSGVFESKKNTGGGLPKLPKDEKIQSTHVEKLRDDLLHLKSFWEKDNIIEGALIEAHYKRLIPKSKRIQCLFSSASKTANDTIVGARYSDSGSHIITHYIRDKILNNTIEDLTKCIQILKERYHGFITSDDLENIKNPKEKWIDKNLLSKTKFIKIIVDCCFLEKFDRLKEINKVENPSIVTIYDTQSDLVELMKNLGITINKDNTLNNTTMLLQPIEFEILKEKAPYLIAMTVTDLNEIPTEESMYHDPLDVISIPKPNNEPVIGVIDTLFDKTAYFADWVDYHEALDSEIEITEKDYVHGSRVTSIIVDGPSFNPSLDDGCGRFRVRHFGVATAKEFSSFTVLRKIEEIVKRNPDIKVWNLCLGSKKEINENFISSEASILDEIQAKYDVIFVIAGTNDENDTYMKIGAPADSLNALVVNSVKKDKTPAEYSRKGNVLRYFQKPDVSYYGGDKKDPMVVWTKSEYPYSIGTSYAAPWITRKVAFLIYVLGMNKETAKALIIDSAIGWHGKLNKEEAVLKGYGVVPISIQEIVKSPKNEIKFIISQTCELYNTYNHRLPVPISKGQYPFIAKAVLCYFPHCTRNQGVDYTNTELDISFGRIKEKQIISINHNEQGSEGKYTYEEKARNDFQKWDNVKYVYEKEKEKNNPRKAYENPLWGISIRKKERLSIYSEPLRFGLVITLKEINNINRIEDFKYNCTLRGWNVETINIDNKLELYNKAEEILEFK